MSAASSHGWRPADTDVGAPKDPFNGFLLSRFFRNFLKKKFNDLVVSRRRGSLLAHQRLGATDEQPGVAKAAAGVSGTLGATQAHTGTQNHTQAHTGTLGHTGTRSRETQRWRQSAVGRSTESTAHVFVCLLICSNIEKIT